MGSTVGVFVGFGVLVGTGVFVNVGKGVSEGFTVGVGCGAEILQADKIIENNKDIADKA